MGNLTHLMIHCAATPEGMHFDKEDIIRWHTAPREDGGRGWRRAGYSEVFLLDGTMQNIYDYDADDYVESWELTNGAKGWNGKTRHICYIGGTDQSGKNAKDTRTDEQKKAIEAYVKVTLRLQPHLKVIGHNQVARKACPSFNVPAWAKKIGIKDKNIDEKYYW
jgi:N-acetylmuramoyl-L-alanine amidase